MERTERDAVLGICATAVLLALIIAIAVVVDHAHTLASVCH